MKRTYWPKDYCEDLSLIVARAKEQRSEKVCEILLGLNDRIMSTNKSPKKPSGKLSPCQYFPGGLENTSSLLQK